MTDVAPWWAWITLTIASIGMIYSVFGLRDALRDLRALQQSQRTVRRMTWIVAFGNIRTEVLIMIVQMGFVALSSVVLFVPGEWLEPRGTALVRFTIVMAAVVLMAKCLTDRWDRAEIRRL